VVERHDRITGFAVEQNHGACSACDPGGALDAVDGSVFGFDAGNALRRWWSSSTWTPAAQAF
jgi:hypothetical protein